VTLPLHPCSRSTWHGIVRRLNLQELDSFVAGAGGVKKRLVAVALTALTPAIGMLAYNEITARSERSTEVHRQAAQTARQAASEVRSVIEGVKGLLVATASIPSIADQDPAACNTVLKSVASKLASVQNILVLDKAGTLVCDCMGWKPGTDFGDRDYVQRALVTDDLVVGEYTVARVSHRAILPMAVALKRGTETIGILATGVRLEWLQDRIRERGLSPGGSLTISDRKGVILARNPEPEKFVGTRIPDQYQPLLSAEQPGTIELFSQDGTKRIMGYTPVSDANPLYVSTGLSESVAFGPIDRASLTGLIMMAIGAALAFSAAFYVGNRFILNPINHIVSVLQRWRDGQVDARTKMRGRHGELGEVGASVDGLLDELEVRRRESVRSDEQRALMAKELSHRVKNTMAIIQAIARQTFKNRSEENAVFASRVGALAGAYDVLQSENWKAADIREVLVRALSPVGGERSEGITLSGPTCLLGPEAVTALSLVVHELATNALKYGALSEATGRLEVLWRQNDGRIELDWREIDGPAVKPPENEGFGSKLIRNAFSPTMDPKSETEYAADGLKFHLSFVLNPTDDREDHAQ
jgi:two-component sensor histidine kinase